VAGRNKLLPQLQSKDQREKSLLSISWGALTVGGAQRVSEDASLTSYSIWLHSTLTMPLFCARASAITSEYEAMD
jgi:hypothetical protein